MSKFTKLVTSFFIISFSSCFASKIIEFETNYPFHREKKIFEGCQEIENFSSMNLKGKKSIDLSHRKLNDEDIRKLSLNESSGSIININLSENPSLTVKSIEYISTSPYLGSIRDLPQISDSCGLPATTIYVQVQDTNIKKDEITKYSNTKNGTKNFSITYIHPVLEHPTSDSVDYGIKFVECDFY